MSPLAIVFISFGVSMDALAVSITNGMVLRKVRIKEALRIGMFFGFFQAIMPLIGWLLGVKFQGYITKIDHWIAFILLSFIGGKMLYEAVKSKGEDCPVKGSKEEVLSNRELVLLAVATSIDALVVGISFAALKMSIIRSITVIGIITFGICFIGVLIGKRCSCIFRNRAEVFGGAVLIIIAIKVLIEHIGIF
ncbi:manganese efflux pump MntP [Clostridium bovifaecis]|uniref:Putative manganese efflux pump MntP n=1 Tax=Clostridium bovifaecis TaxID=2184719 RepID=A0A6I6ELU5_9CLOT|nr:manganese efflux pump MntP [Clostridium bovifaecis]